MWRVRILVDDGGKSAACVATLPSLDIDGLVSVVRPVTTGSIIGARAYRDLAVSYNVQSPGSMAQAVYLYSLGDENYAHVYGFVASEYSQPVVYREDMDPVLRDNLDLLGLTVWGSAEALVYASDEQQLS